MSRLLALLVMLFLAPAVAALMLTVYLACALVGWSRIRHQRGPQPTHRDRREYDAHLRQVEARLLAAG